MWPAPRPICSLALTAWLSACQMMSTFSEVQVGLHSIAKKLLFVKINDARGKYVRQQTAPSQPPADPPHTYTPPSTLQRGMSTTETGGTSASPGIQVHSSFPPTPLQLPSNSPQTPLKLLRLGFEGLVPADHDQEEDGGALDLELLERVVDNVVGAVLGDHLRVELPVNEPERPPALKTGIKPKSRETRVSGISSDCKHQSVSDERGHYVEHITRRVWKR